MLFYIGKGLYPGREHFVFDCWSLCFLPAEQVFPVVSPAHFASTFSFLNDSISFTGNQNSRRCIQGWVEYRWYYNATSYLALEGSWLLFLSR